MQTRRTDDCQNDWEHFHHRADIGVRGYGPDPPSAFARAALAMTAAMIDPRTVKPVNRVTIHCRAPGLELLLYDWLNALIYEMSTRRLLFSFFEVKITAHGQLWELQAEARGEKLQASRHHPAVEVKGATLTELSVRKIAAGRWLAQCVIDL